MAKTINLIEQKFGKWTVIEKAGCNKWGSAMWLCRCQCGNTGIVESGGLRKGKSTQCKKCGNKQKGHKLRKENMINSSFLRQIKSNAKSRNIEYKLTKEELIELYLNQKNKCALSGAQIIIEKSYMKFERERTKMDNHASLDRIDPNKSYSINNVQWVHKKINRMKQNLSQEEFIKFCNLVAKKHPREV